MDLKLHYLSRVGRGWEHLLGLGDGVGAHLPFAFNADRNKLEVQMSKFGDTGYPPEPSVSAANRYLNGVKDLYIFRAGQGDGNIIVGG